MKYRLRYQTRGKVETYIAMATATISVLADELYSENERVTILQNIADEVLEQAATTKKGLTARPKCEIYGESAPELTVYNTNGIEILTVYFERVHENCGTITRLH